jgi:hypothetical protein
MSSPPPSECVVPSSALYQITFHEKSLGLRMETSFMKKYIVVSMREIACFLADNVVYEHDRLIMISLRHCFQVLYSIYSSIILFWFLNIYIHRMMTFRSKPSQMLQGAGK